MDTSRTPGMPPYPEVIFSAEGSGAGRPSVAAGLSDKVGIHDLSLESRTSALRAVAGGPAVPATALGLDAEPEHPLRISVEEQLGALFAKVEFAEATAFLVGGAVRCVAVTEDMAVRVHLLVTAAS